MVAIWLATWRNGSAFGFDRRRHQKVAGSSPAVVTFWFPLCQHVTLRDSHGSRVALPPLLKPVGIALVRPEGQGIPEANTKAAARRSSVLR